MKPQDTFAQALCLRLLCIRIKTCTDNFAWAHVAAYARASPAPLRLAQNFGVIRNGHVGGPDCARRRGQRRRAPRSWPSPWSRTAAATPLRRPPPCLQRPGRLRICSRCAVSIADRRRCRSLHVQMRRTRVVSVCLAWFRVCDLPHKYPCHTHDHSGFRAHSAVCNYQLVVHWILPIGQTKSSSSGLIIMMSRFASRLSSLT